MQRLHSYLEAWKQEDAMSSRAATPLQDPTLATAIDLYCAAFGRDALPCIAGLNNAMAGAAAIMLVDAVEARRPLRYRAIADALAGPQSPESASL